MAPTRLLAGVVLLCACLVWASAAPAVGEEVLRLDCNARLHLFPTGILNATFDASRFLKGSGLAEVVTKKLKDRFKCLIEREETGASAKLTDLDWSTGWSLGPQAVINAFRAAGRRTFDQLYPAVQRAMRKAYLKLPFFWDSFFDLRPASQAWLPSTCLGDGPCFFTVDARASLGATFKVAYDLCPTTSLPYLSVFCEGSTCSRALQPCASDGECRARNEDTGAVCLNAADPPTQADVFAAFKALQLYDSGDAEALVASVLRDAVDYYRSLFGLPAAAASDAVSYRMCLVTASRLGVTASTDSPPKLLFRGVPFPRATNWPPGDPNFLNSVVDYLVKDVAGCSSSGGTTTCPQISAWDGVQGKSSAASDARKSGRDVAYSGPRVVLDSQNPITKVVAFDCEGSVHVGLMNWGLSARVPIVRPIASWLGTYVKKLQTARYQARSLTLPAASQAYYAPWTAAYLLSTFTNAADKPSKPDLSSFYAGNDAAFMDVSSTDCKLSSMADKGYCLARINKFLPKDLKLEMALAQCSGEASGLPAFEIGISGTGAGLLTTHQACNTDADCGGTSVGVCENFESTLEGGLGLPQRFFQLYDLVSNAIWGNGPRRAPTADDMQLNEIQIQTDNCAFASEGRTCGIYMEFAQKQVQSTASSSIYKTAAVLPNLGLLELRFYDSANNRLSILKTTCVNKWGDPVQYYSQYFCAPGASGPMASQNAYDGPYTLVDTVTTAIQFSSLFGNSDCNMYANDYLTRSDNSTIAICGLSIPQNKSQPFNNAQTRDGTWAANVQGVISKIELVARPAEAGQQEAIIDSRTLAIQPADRQFCSDQRIPDFDGQWVGKGTDGKCRPALRKRNQVTYLPDALAQGLLEVVGARINDNLFVYDPSSYPQTPRNYFVDMQYSSNALYPLDGSSGVDALVVELYGKAWKQRVLKPSSFNGTTFVPGTWEDYLETSDSVIASLSYTGTSIFSGGFIRFGLNGGALFNYSVPSSYSDPKYSYYPAYSEATVYLYVRPDDSSATATAAAREKGIKVPVSIPAGTAPPSGIKGCSLHRKRTSGALGAFELACPSCSSPAGYFPPASYALAARINYYESQSAAYAPGSTYPHLLPMGAIVLPADYSFPTTAAYSKYTIGDYQAGKLPPATPTCSDIPKFCTAGTAANAFYTDNCAKIPATSPFVVPFWWAWQSPSPTPSGSSNAGNGNSALDSILQSDVVKAIVQVEGVVSSYFTWLPGLLPIVYGTNNRAWNWRNYNDYGYTYFNLETYGPPTLTDQFSWRDGTAFQFGPDAYSIVEGTCPASVPASFAALYRDVMNLQADRAGRPKLSDAKMRICLPTPLDSMRLSAVPKTSDGRYLLTEASAMPAGSASMKVTLSIGLSKADFTKEKQDAFLDAISGQFKVARSRLSILSIDDARRRALLAGAAQVQLAVASAPGSDAASVTSSIQSAVNSAILRGSAATLGGISVSGALAAINTALSGVSGAVSMGDDGAKDIQLIPNLPGAASSGTGAATDNSCATLTSCSICASSGQCMWCGQLDKCTSTATSTCPATSVFRITEAAKCSFASPFKITFNTTTNPSDAYFVDAAGTAKLELQTWFALLLGIDRTLVAIKSLARGSVIVNGEVTSATSVTSANNLASALLARVQTEAPKSIGGVVLQATCAGGACTASGITTTTGSSSNPSWSSQAAASSDDDWKGKVIGGVVGGVGGFFLLIVIAFLVYCCFCRKNRNVGSHKAGKGGKGDLENPAWTGGDAKKPTAPPAPPVVEQVRM